MKRKIITLLILIIINGCKTEKVKSNKKIINKENKIEKRDDNSFKVSFRKNVLSTDDLSNEEIEQLVDNFIFDDVKMDFQKYPTKVERISKERFKYDTKVIDLLDSEKNLNVIFERGLLYPDILGSTNFIIKGLHSVPQRPGVTKIKRFKFYLLDSINDNSPKTFLFKLENKDGIDEMTMSEFIENAELIFLKEVPQEKYNQAISVWKDGNTSN